MVRLITSLLCAVFLVVASQPAEARELRFFTIEVPPWAGHDDQGRKYGVFTDLVAEFRKRTGHLITEEYMTFARLKRVLEVGSHDCGIFVWLDSNAGISERGEKVYDFPLGVIARKGVRLESYDDLESLSITVLRGLKITDIFDNDIGLIKEENKDYYQGLRKISHKRVDAMAGMISTIRYSAAKEGWDQYLGDHLVLRQAPLAIQCSKASRNRDLLPELNRVVVEMREDGTLERIFSKNYLH